MVPVSLYLFKVMVENKASGKVRVRDGIRNRFSREANFGHGVAITAHAASTVDPAFRLEWSPLLILDGCVCRLLVWEIYEINVAMFHLAVQSRRRSLN